MLFYEFEKWNIKIISCNTNKLNVTNNNNTLQLTSQCRIAGNQDSES